MERGRKTIDETNHIIFSSGSRQAEVSKEKRMDHGHGKAVEGGVDHIVVVVQGM